jgi:hypothetical protein
MKRTKHGLIFWLDVNQTAALHYFNRAHWMNKVGIVRWFRWHCSQLSRYITDSALWCDMRWGCLNISI